MDEITEIFSLKMKEGALVDAVREAVRKDFVALDGVTPWDTLVTTDTSRQTHYADIFEFPDHVMAKAVTPQFTERPATQAFLAEIDETIFGQSFTTHNPQTTE